MNISNLDHIDVLIKASKTFLQAFVASLGASDLIHANLSGGKQLFIAAAAAGISAVTNYVLQVIEV